MGRRIPFHLPGELEGKYSRAGGNMSRSGEDTSRSGKASPYEATDTRQDGPSIGVTGVKWRSTEVMEVERERVPGSEEREVDRCRHLLVGDQRIRLSGSLRESLLDLPRLIDAPTLAFSVRHRERPYLTVE